MFFFQKLILNYHINEQENDCLLFQQCKKRLSMLLVIDGFVNDSHDGLDQSVMQVI